MFKLTTKGGELAVEAEKARPMDGACLCQQPSGCCCIQRAHCFDKPSMASGR